jgi:hypothetical protein
MNQCAHIYVLINVISVVMFYKNLNRDFDDKHKTSHVAGPNTIRIANVSTQISHLKLQYLIMPYAHHI